MNNDKNLTEVNANENKTKKIWTYVGLGVLAVVLAVFTVLVVSVSLY